MSATKLEIDENIMKRKFLFNDEEEELKTLFPPKSQYTAAIIKPKPGICVKTKNNGTNEKVFINVCISDGVPAPENITNDELIAIFESDNPSDFKIPMSIGQPHEETDKGGQACVAYDIVINPSFFTKMDENPLFHNFFMIVTIEGLDEKYGVSLDKNCWTVLKNKKYHGNMSDQTVRTSLPLIQELSGVKEWKAEDFPALHDPTPKEEGMQEPLIKEISSKKLEESPKKTKPKVLVEEIVPSPSSDGSTQALQLEIEMPKMMSGEKIGVSVGEDRVVVESEHYFLDHLVTHTLNRRRCKAFFIKTIRVLVLWIELGNGE